MKIPKTGIESAVNSINSTRTNGVDKTTLGKGKAGESAAGALRDSSSARVALSEKAQLMAKAKDVATQTSVDNSEKVARLQKMIDQGTYNIDAASVADRLVDTHMEFPD